MTSRFAAGVRVALLAFALLCGVAAQAQARFTLVFKQGGVRTELPFDTIEECEDALQALGGPLANIVVSPSAVERLSPYELVALGRTGAMPWVARPGVRCLFDVAHGPRCVNCWNLWLRLPLFQQPLQVPQRRPGAAGSVAFLVLGYLAFDVRRAQPWRPQVAEPAQAVQATMPAHAHPAGQLRSTMQQVIQAVQAWLSDWLQPAGLGEAAPGPALAALAPVPGPALGPAVGPRPGPRPGAVPDQDPALPGTEPVERLGRLRIHHVPPAQAAAPQADAAPAGSGAGATQAPAGVVQPGLAVLPSLPDVLPALPDALTARPTLRIHLPRPRVVVHLPPGSGLP